MRLTAAPAKHTINSFETNIFERRLLVCAFPPVGINDGFLGALAEYGFDSCSSFARFEDGNLVEVWHAE